MLISAIIDAILFRVGKHIITDFGEPFVLASMNRIYNEVNEDLRALEKTKTFDFSTVPDVTVTPYMDLPDDWLYPRKISPYLMYRDAQVFENEEPNTCSFFSNRFYVASVAEDASYDALYYAQGSRLVNETDAVYALRSAAEKLLYANAPEWKPTFLHSFLIYATALELAQDYPLRKQDERKYSKLHEQLDRRRWLQTQAHPTLEGEKARENDYTVQMDPYAL